MDKNTLKKIMLSLLAVIAGIAVFMRLLSGYLEDRQAESDKPLATKVPSAQQDADVINILAAGAVYASEGETYYDEIATILSNFDVAVRIEDADVSDAASLGFLEGDPVQMECGGISIAVLPLCEEEDKPAQIYDPEVVLPLVQSLKENNDLVLVTMLWDSEEELVSAHQKEVSEQLAQAGADLIMGSVPHIIQPVCHVFDALVFYSLGDLDGEDGLLAGVTITRTVANDTSHIELTNPRVQVVRSVETENGAQLVLLEDLPDTEEEIREYSDLINVMEEEVRMGGLE